MDIRNKKKRVLCIYVFALLFLFIQPYEIHGIGERVTGVGEKGRDPASGR